VHVHGSRSEGLVIRYWASSSPSDICHQVTSWCEQTIKTKIRAKLTFCAFVAERNQLLTYER
jgi:hypothetical protein